MSFLSPACGSSLLLPFNSGFKVLFGALWKGFWKRSPVSPSQVWGNRGGRQERPLLSAGVTLEVHWGTAVKQSIKSTYSDLCQRKTWVWEHLHLFSIIPRICCRMYVIHLVIREITFVANSLPIRNFIEFVYHAVASYEVWKMVIFGVPAVVTFWGLNSGMGWNSLEGLGFLRTAVWELTLWMGHYSRGIQ